MRYVVGARDDLPPGSSTIVYPDRVKGGVGVFNVKGEFYALKNACPHMGGPLCKGSVRGTSEAAVTADGELAVQWVRDGEIICLSLASLGVRHQDRTDDFPVQTESAQLSRVGRTAGDG